MFTLDDEWGSPEIFPEGFASEVWGLYLKALKKADRSKIDLNAVRKQIEALEGFESYLFDQEGVYPEEAAEIVRKRWGKK
jgi:hypothetical protein